MIGSLPSAVSNMLITLRWFTSFDSLDERICEVVTRFPHRLCNRWAGAHVLVRSRDGVLFLRLPVRFGTVPQFFRNRSCYHQLSLCICQLHCGPDSVDSARDTACLEAASYIAHTF